MLQRLSVYICTLPGKALGRDELSPFDYLSFSTEAIPIKYQTQHVIRSCLIVQAMTLNAA